MSNFSLFIFFLYMSTFFVVVSFIPFCFVCVCFFQWVSICIGWCCSWLLAFLLSFLGNSLLVEHLYCLILSFILGL